MTSEQFQSGQPIYTELGGSLKSEAWDSQKEDRIKILRDLIIPQINKTETSELGIDGVRFLRNRIFRLVKMCSMLGKEISEDQKDSISTVNLLMSEDGKTFDYNLNDEGQNLQERPTPHTPETLKATEIILHALTPEMGLNLTDDLQKVEEKAKTASNVRRGEVTIENLYYRFQTIIPGITVSFYRDPFSIANRVVGLEPNLMYNKSSYHS